MGPRAKLCFAISKALIREPEVRNVEYTAYSDWRSTSLRRSWAHFADDVVRGKDVLDFGCGDGPLSFYIAQELQPRSVVGVDISGQAIGRAKKTLGTLGQTPKAAVEFRIGSRSALPVEDKSIDTLLAFDCLEHVMEIEAVLAEWYRVLRPGGRCLIEWFPFKGPWGPHMEALIPIPWAHVFFGERAMFRVAEKIYDSPTFTPRHWDLDCHGRKKPNKWRAWSTFEEQGYLNKLDLPTFDRFARSAGFVVERWEKHGFGGNWLRRSLAAALMALPLVGEYFVSYVIVELVKPMALARR